MSDGKTERESFVQHFSPCQNVSKAEINKHNLTLILEECYTLELLPTAVSCWPCLSMAEPGHHSVSSQWAVGWCGLVKLRQSRVMEFKLKMRVHPSSFSMHQAFEEVSDTHSVHKCIQPAKSSKLLHTCCSCQHFCP